MAYSLNRTWNNLSDDVAGRSVGAVIKAPYWIGRETLVLLKAIAPANGPVYYAYNLGLNCISAGAAIRNSVKDEEARIGAYMLTGKTEAELLETIADLAQRGRRETWKAPSDSMNGIQWTGYALQIYGWCLLRGAFDNPNALYAPKDPELTEETLIRPLVYPRGTTAKTLSKKWLTVVVHCSMCLLTRTLFSQIASGEWKNAFDMDGKFEEFGEDIVRGVLAEGVRRKLLESGSELCVLPGNWYWSPGYEGPSVSLVDQEDCDDYGKEMTVDLSELTQEARDYVEKCIEEAPPDEDPLEYALRCVDAYRGPLVPDTFYPSYLDDE
ncbi:hypothetical protein [Crucian carp herpesvirus]|uniref:ORF135A n=1 Tax=Cyprinid herpesvirus 2 TaxID=317878 RepID=A0A0E3XA23_CYHV2|nr:hypothetical protein [Cyprinid herpesvirus 2]AMB21698.1 ORF135A [Cyprinid herpesvirus 2]APB92972.1 hypothetical protein [Crucian carp herpesvirus]QAU54851.1 protein ORF135A [Cyprinid herpesvirus 2]QIM55303.1 hypothetical protein [Cyprinid herpesvirus 2]